MLDRFLSYIKAEKLIHQGQKVLVAVSGGIDSMALVDLFLQGGYPIEIAHVNHHLRGNESNGDSEFVRSFCTKNGIKFHLLDIDPKIFAYGNIQEVARQHRYEWLAETARSHEMDLIATAHHSDDVIETVLMNFMRGTGLDGLKGFSNQLGNIIRPLIFATKIEIYNYAKSRQLSHREDSSNATDKYMRNKIRNQILPSIYQADPRALLGLPKSVENVHQSLRLIDFLVTEYCKNLITVQNEETTIALSPIVSIDVAKPLLYELLKKYGFNFDQCSLIIDHNSQSGLTFLSTDYECITNRNALILRKKKFKPSDININITALPYTFEYQGMIYRIELCQVPTSIDKPQHTLYLDAQSIHFPVTIRLRSNGDRIKTLGLGGKTQKVKDVLINKKLSAFEKEKVLIFEDVFSIKAILMIGISDEAKMTESTVSCITITTQSTLVDQ